MGLLDLTFFLLQSIFQLEQLISYKLDEATMNLLQVRLFNVAPDKLIGSLGNGDGNGNENCKKARGLNLFSKTKTLHVHHPFLYISAQLQHESA